MPSPSGALLKVVVRETPWLRPDVSAPLTIPDSIQPGRLARVPGQLKAFIIHETSPRTPGVRLYEKETVSLLGYSERLNRAVPEFAGGVNIVIQCPLQLSAPAYMDCMTKVEQMSISWMVRMEQRYRSLP